MKVIEVTITEKMLEDAKEHHRFNHAKFGHVGTKLRHADKYHGFLGEEVVKAFLGTATKPTTYLYDLDYKDKSIEIKTSCRKTEPKQFHDVSVLPGAEHRGIDYFVFVQILSDFTKGWILGVMPTRDFYAQSHLIKKGELFVPGIISKMDMYRIGCKDLYDAEQLTTEGV